MDGWCSLVALYQQWTAKGWIKKNLLSIINANRIYLKMYWILISIILDENSLKTHHFSISRYMHISKYYSLSSLLLYSLTLQIHSKWMLLHIPTTTVLCHCNLSTHSTILCEELRHLKIWNKEVKLIVSNFIQRTNPNPRLIRNTINQKT